MKVECKLRSGGDMPTPPINPQGLLEKILLYLYTVCVFISEEIRKP